MVPTWSETARDDDGEGSSNSGPTIQKTQNTTEQAGQEPGQDRSLAGDEVMEDAGEGSPKLTEATAMERGLAALGEEKRLPLFFQPYSPRLLTRLLTS